MSKASSFGHSGFLMESPVALQSAPRRGPALVAGVLWLAAGLSAGYWVLQFLGRSPVTPVSTVATAPAPLDPLAVARTLGAVPAAAAMVPGNVAAPVPRYALLGVVATGTKGGAALIAVDSQPPRPYRVGAELEGGLVLQAVTRRSVRLGPTMQAPATLELSLPETAAASPS